MVQLFANHDFGSHTPWPRIPILQLVQHHRKDLIVYRSHCLKRYYRCEPDWKHLYSILLPFRIESFQFPSPGVLCRPQEEPGGAGKLFVREDAAFEG